MGRRWWDHEYSGLGFGRKGTYPKPAEGTEIPEAMRLTLFSDLDMPIEPQDPRAAGQLSLIADHGTPWGCNATAENAEDWEDAEDE